MPTQKKPLLSSSKAVTVELGLQDNNLGGAIPEDIFMIETLEILTLANNNLTSIIPTNVGDMQSMILLSLAGNSLTGAIPTSISAIGSLEILDLSQNQLSGAIPAIGGLSELRKWPVRDFPALYDINALPLSYYRPAHPLGKPFDGKPP